MNIARSTPLTPLRKNAIVGLNHGTPNRLFDSASKPSPFKFPAAVGSPSRVNKSNRSPRQTQRQLGIGRGLPGGGQRTHHRTTSAAHSLGLGNDIFQGAPFAFTYRAPTGRDHGLLRSGLDGGLGTMRHEGDVSDLVVMPDVRQETAIIPHHTSARPPSTTDTKAINIQADYDTLQRQLIALQSSQTELNEKYILLLQEKTSLETLSSTQQGQIKALRQSQQNSDAALLAEKERSAKLRRRNDILRDDLAAARERVRELEKMEAGYDQRVRETFEQMADSGQLAHYSLTRPGKRQRGTEHEGGHGRKVNDNDKDQDREPITRRRRLSSS